MEPKSKYPDRRIERRTNWRFIVALISATFMPLLMLLLGVWIEQKFSQIDHNQSSIDEVKKIMPELIELYQMRRELQYGVENNKELNARIELFNEKIQIIDKEVGRLDRQSGGNALKLEHMQDRLNLYNERINLLNSNR